MDLDNIITAIYEFGTGVLSRTLACPLETVKLLQQLRTSPALEGTLRIPAESDGVSLLFWVAAHAPSGALWRGNLANILKTIPTALMEPLRPLIFKRNQPLVEESLSPLEIISDAPISGLSGISSLSTSKWRSRLVNIMQCTLMGGVALLVIHPLDVARTRLALDILPPHSYSGIIDCLSKIAANEGVFALYKGYGISLFGIAMYRTFYVIIFDIVAEYVATLKLAESKALCVALVTTLASVLTYPLDTIRRHQMVDGGYSTQIGRLNIPRYSSALDCLGHIINKHGIRALYDGCFFNTLHTSAMSLVLLACDSIRRNV